jgi:hypothetical protein
MLEKYKLDGKVKKLKSWLKEVREKSFTRKAIDLKLPQLCHQEFPERNQLQGQELSTQNRTLSEEERKMTRNMHIVNQRLTRANFSRRATQDRSSMRLLSQLQQVESNLSRLTIDSKFEGDGQQFSVFLTKGLLEVSDDGNNNYYEFHPGSLFPLKEELRKIHIDGPSQKRSLKIIEKQSAF